MPHAPRPPGLVNLRDLGGHPTADGHRIAPGRVFRAAQPIWLSDAEVEQLRSLGIASRLDLRSEGEPESAPCIELDLAGVEVHHVPFRGLTTATELPDLASDEQLGISYLRTAESNAEGLRSALELLASETKLATLVHCAWGKDRAGIVVATLLELVGVPRELVVADYVRSEDAVETLIDRALSNVDPDRARQVRPKVVARPVVHAREATITTYLELLDHEHGGVRGLLADAGADLDELVGGLRDRLLA
ncbi:MAG: tyrosine-protein phosphatase [Nitriliruptoraceae bacterium]